MDHRTCCFCQPWCTGLNDRTNYTHPDTLSQTLIKTPSFEMLIKQRIQTPETLLFPCFPENNWLIIVIRKPLKAPPLQGPVLVEFGGELRNPREGLLFRSLEDQGHQGHQGHQLPQGVKLEIRANIQQLFHGYGVLQHVHEQTRLVCHGLASNQRFMSVENINVRSFHIKR